jgi:S1-C subfamily serine protease
MEHERSSVGQFGDAERQAGAASVVPPPPPPPPLDWPGWQPAAGAAPDRGPGSAAPRRRRRGLIVAAAGSALALAGGAVATWAAVGAGGTPTLSAAEIASHTDAGIVDVVSTINYGQGKAAGTGMVLTPNGEVLTNNHVIAGATAIRVRDVGNGRTYTARVVGYSDTKDVAVLQLQGASGLSTIPLGDSSTLRVGQQVVGLGNAEGKGGTPAVAAGTITGLAASIVAADAGTGAQEHLSGMIRTNAAIQPGDSGGPLVDEAGEVVGMDTAASASSGSQPGTAASVATTAFAIPINRALAIADQIEHGQSSATVHIGATGFLGVAVSSQSSQLAPGAAIEGVIRGTPAAAAGLAAGDTITSVGGQQVTSNAALQNVIEKYHPGDTVRVTWTGQFGQAHSATVTLVTGPAG